MTKVLAAGAALAVLMHFPALAQAEDVRALKANYFGIVRVGMQTTAIGEATFKTKSSIGEKIVQACRPTTFCKLRARTTIKGEVVEFVSAEPLPQFDGPDEMLDYVYRQYDEEDFNQGIQLRDAGDMKWFYTPALTQAVAKEVARATKAQEEAFDRPWYDSQEGTPKNTRINTTMRGPDRAVSKINFAIGETDPAIHQSVVFQSVRTSDGWRIDDVMFPSMSQKADTTWRKLLAKVPKG